MVIVPRPSFVLFRMLNIIGRYSMRVMKMRQGQNQNCQFKTIDSFCFSSRIAPNMFTAFALPRTRRPKPASLGEGREFFALTMVTQ